MNDLTQQNSSFKLQGWRLLLVIVILFTNLAVAFSQVKEMNYPVKKEVKWFTDARFGMFIHWTPLGAIDQEIGWSWGNQVPKEKYMQGILLNSMPKNGFI
jgi:hypothetical protein